MLINRDYIVSNINALIENMQVAQKVPVIQLESKTNAVKSLIKAFFPQWIKKTVKSILKLLWKKSYIYDNVYTGGATRWYPFMFNKRYDVHAVNFMRYCFENEINFETSDYYSPEDEILIQKHINNRIHSVIGDNIIAPLSERQMEYLKRIERWKIKKHKDYYLLSIDEEKYKLATKAFESCVFDMHYGLKELSDEIKKYIEGKDFLDIGAYIGDSALVFLSYNPRKIYAYEPVNSNYNFLKYVEREHENKISAINKGVGDKACTMEIITKRSGSTLLASTTNEDLPTEKISITTIDDECRDKTIGLIKMDIEGFEYYAIKGGLDTIKRDKPLLLISIYHTGKDFFEIPPLLKQAVPEYKFKYMDLQPFHGLYEKILVGYITQ